VLFPGVIQLKTL